jgi:uncharacterized protein (TIGR02246 family)
MKNLVVIIFSGLLMLLAVNCNQQSTDTTVADKETIKGINPVWFKSYNAGDANAIAALYAEDAVLNPPGAPPARGKAAIQEYLTKDVGASREAGITMISDFSKAEANVSGNLAWEWGTFTVKDKAGADIDNGKYVTVYEKRDGKWLIIRDIWNSDGLMQTTEMN